jgi:hypothetical protein
VEFEINVLANEQDTVCSSKKVQVLLTVMDDDEKRQQDDWANSRKNRLPSFTEVLSRRTRPPVDLFMF